VSATVGACVPWIWLAYIVVARLSKGTMERYAAIEHREANWRRRMARVRGDELPSSWRLLMPGWANGLADKIRHAIGASRASVPTNDVIYDDGWTSRSCSTTSSTTSSRGSPRAPRNNHIVTGEPGRAEYGMVAEEIDELPVMP
jgi:hypothetical protein